MKLSGNKKNGRYARGSHHNLTRSADRGAETKTLGAAVKKRGTHRLAKIVMAILAVILVLLVAFYIYLKMGLQPPDVNDVPKPTSSSAAAVASGEPTVQPSRDKTKFTFVILGMDDGNGNTDTILVATFDDTNYTLNVVSIPRDTLVNVSWPTKKANSLYANGGIDEVNEGMTALLGYKPDYYVKVNLDAFSKLVDGIGGVNFDVPKDMYYADPSQNLLIDLKKGPQLLDGEHALQLVRARKNVWATGDIGRIEMQQAFLKTAAGQILEKKNSLKLRTLIDIFLNDIDTNLSSLDLAWFAQEFLKMDAENVNFETIPAKYNDSVNGDSYCTIKLKDWLGVINTKLNPFDFEVKAEDLSILTRGEDGKLYVTDGNWAGKKSWGSSSGSSEAGGKPETSAEPSATPSPSPSVSTDTPPSPSAEESSPESSPDSSPDDSTDDAPAVTTDDSAQSPDSAVPEDND